MRIRNAAGQRLAHFGTSPQNGEIRQLTSFDRAPAERIGVWERVHELKLPESLAHPLIAIIAAATALTIDQLDAEQRERRARGTARTAGTKRGERSD